MASAEASPPTRIFIIGGPGSGKTTLSRELAEILEVPAYHLDDIARIGGGTGPARSDAERRAMVQEVARSAGWIAEGVHIHWTDDLLAKCDVVVWLDQTSWLAASLGIVRRFASGATQEPRGQQGMRKRTRIRDYAHHLRDLASAVRETYAFQFSRADRVSAETPSKRALEVYLATFGGKVVRCRTRTDVAQLVTDLRSRSA